VDAGVPRTAAAIIARNLTVDFNAKGNATPAINATYMFFNAAMQGSAAMFTTLKNSNIARALAGSYMFMGLLEAILATGDDDEYEKLDKYVRERNIVIAWAPLGLGESGEFGKMPISYGYNVFKTTGTEMGRMALHGSTPAESAGVIVSAILNSFNPLGGQDLFAMMVPTVADPISEVVRNKNFMDSTIKPSYPGDLRPMSEQYYPSVSSWSKSLTKYLNDSTGGNTFRGGWIDISPEQIDHLFSAYTGGVGRLITRSIRTGEDLSAGRPLDLDQVPFVRNFYTRTFGEMPTWRAYDKISDATSALEAELKGLSGAGRAEEALAARNRDPVLLRLIGPFNAYAKIISSLRKQEGLVRASSMAEDAKETALERLRLQQYDIHRRAIELHDRTRKAAE